MYEPALHVNGLPLSLTDEYLHDLFAAFGTVVSARLVRDMDGKSLGFGIVDMYRPSIRTCISCGLLSLNAGKSQGRPTLTMTVP